MESNFLLYDDYFPAAGNRSFYDGTFGGIGTVGNYRSSTSSGSNDGYSLSFFSGGQAGATTTSVAQGFPFAVWQNNLTRMECS